MRRLGFKGSGSRFARETDDFVFVVGLQGSQWSPSLCLNVGLHPKTVTTNGFRDLDFRKLKPNECELSTRLSPRGLGYDNWWKYSPVPAENVRTAMEMASLVEKYFAPVIGVFEKNPLILETINVADLNGRGEGLAAKIGIAGLASTSPRLAWFFARLNERSDLAKAKEFASYGLSISEVPTFFAIPDLKRILAKSV